MRLTPYQISRDNTYYNIPIYQRLFEWDRDNIQTLLNDLYKTFVASNGTEDYYIGMLTATYDKELVDGQQRFTVMMLIGCVFKHDIHSKEWAQFLFDGKPRLRFTSRPLDDSYLQALINGDFNKSIGYFNKKMKAGIIAVQDFLRDKVQENELEEFASYIFHHLSFFITQLPTGYNPRDLNKYFERMNTAGKNLEQHEILKVKLLSNLSEDISLYMTLWNRLSDTDSVLIHRRDNENIDALSLRKNRALRSNIQEILSENLINGMGGNDIPDDQTIVSISPSNKAPNPEKTHYSDSHCALTFPYLLLQCLYWKLGGEIEDRIDDFFKPNNLLDIFQKYLPYEGNGVNKEDIKNFMNILLRGRLALDICFIRPTDYGYELDMNLDEDDPNLKQLLMFESMIYVSSSNFSNYRWFGWIMRAIEQFKGMGTANELYKFLKSKDDELNPLPDISSLKYGQEIRYWFWRLDYYIWKNRKRLFADNPAAQEVAENYIFRRNRSIEHIAPQTPETDSKMKWDDTEEDTVSRNSFGNLVMISQGLNSSLSNESYEIKTAYVQSYCNQAKSGTIESLKLLVVHQEYKHWDKETIRDHGEKMYEWLRDSFVEE